MLGEARLSNNQSVYRLRTRKSDLTNKYLNLHSRFQETFRHALLRKAAQGDSDFTFFECEDYIYVLINFENYRIQVWWYVDE
ncbi:MAG: hypothetical protein Tsb005_09160 [Gammaproteobacteria bacterium]